VAVPLALLAAAGTLLTIQIVRLSRASAWVDRSDEALAVMYDLQKQVLDQETGLRGYLLTQDQSFLEPFWRARPLELFLTLRGLVADEPLQRAQLDEARGRYDQWYGPAAKAASADAPKSLRELGAMRERRDRMDQLRDAFSRLLSSQAAIRHERAATAQSATTSTLWAIVPLFVGAGLIIAFLTRHQVRAVAVTFSDALDAEKAAKEALEEQAWVRNAQTRVSQKLQGDLFLDEVGRRAAEALALETSASVVAVYWRDPADPRQLTRGAGFALDPGAPAKIKLGEGLVGEAALSQQILRAQEGDVLPRISSATTTRVATEVIVVPASADGVVRAVIELGFLLRPPARVVELLSRVSDSVALAMRSAESKERLRSLLEESQRQGEELQAQQEELQAQQEELRATNDELSQQRDTLRGMHGELASRKDELEASNDELLRQRDALALAQKELAAKASELEKANRYKSEFLANMSHELRTPLNSSLILARLLADNRGGNLTEEQVKFAETIYGSGNDLLELINDILDLSKIEAGRAEVHATTITLGRILESVARTFEPVARDKGLAFVIERLGPENDGELVVDEGKLAQVLRNLLSNALKFTERGQVTLSVGLDAEHVSFAVRDTGIGIPASQHGIIFEAFRQADGTTNRRFGGTGLGLTISRDLTRLLGGDLTVESEVGKGSVFRFQLPRRYRGPVASSPATAVAGTSTTSAKETGSLSVEPRRLPALSRSPLAEATNGHRKPPPASAPLLDVRGGAAGQVVLLVVEDDAAFADVLRMIAEEKGYVCELAATAEEGLNKARALRPSAILLDMNLPDHGGLHVLDSLKRTPETRHIPVHVVSVDDVEQRVLEMGAVGYLQKPANAEALGAILDQFRQRMASLRRLLVVEDDSVQRGAIGRLLDSKTVDIDAVGTVAEALERLREVSYDCVVVDLVLPDGTGLDLLEKMAHEEGLAFPPVIVYTGRSLSADEEQRLRRYSSSIIVKGARSPERLLDEVTLFLHQVESELPPDRQKMLRQARLKETAFDGKTVLVVEDDVRNVFALTSVLEPRGVRLVLARNGKEALKKLEQSDGVSLVLMDLMMPEMDGLEATRAIRALPNPKGTVPIIALTAKAMPDDRQRCLEAGANDYIAKPLDVDMLLSMCRVWMR